MLPLYVKSLYGANNTTTITNDKRLTTEMGVVKEMIERNETSLVWIDNKHWFADIDKERGLKCITYWCAQRRKNEVTWILNGNNNKFWLC